MRLPFLAGLAVAAMVGLHLGYTVTSEGAAVWCGRRRSRGLRQGEPALTQACRAGLVDGRVLEPDQRAQPITLFVSWEVPDRQRALRPLVRRLWRSDLCVSLPSRVSLAFSARPL